MYWQGSFRGVGDASLEPDISRVSINGIRGMHGCVIEWDWRQGLPVPDWSSAGAERTTSWPAAINASLNDRMYDSAQPSSLDWTMRAHWAASAEMMMERHAERLIVKDGRNARDVGR